MVRQYSGDRLLITVLFCAVMLLHAFTVIEIPVIGAIEESLYDRRLTLNMDNELDPNVAIANIDESSIEELGQWPWRRDVLAQLVDTLFEHYQIKALGFDMVFAEASDDTGQEVLDILASTDLKEHSTFQSAFHALQPQLNFDQMFADSLANRNIVTGFVFEQTPKNNVNHLPLPILQLPPQILRSNTLVGAHSYVANLPLLHEKAPYAGFFDNPLLDDDGVFRRVPLVQRIQGFVYPSLSLELARLALGAEKIEVEFDQFDRLYQIKSLKLGERTVPVGESGEIYVPYRGTQHSFPYHSINDLLHKKVKISELKDKVVLVGTDAAGLLDLRTTPFASTFPGVEVHANLVSGILEDRVMEVPDYALSFEVSSIVICTLCLFVIVMMRDPRYQILGILLMIVSILALSQYLWLEGFIMPLASSLVLTIILFITLTVLNMMTEARHKLSIVKMFGQYVPPELVDEMSEEPEKYQLKNTSRELTVLFSDVRSFTTISENLSPDELSELMNLYLTKMTGVIHRNQGTIDKYMGDAIMAFWGAPIKSERHAQLAAKAAVEMIDALDELNEEFQHRGWPEIKVGVGLNTDKMFVGNMGSEFRMAYTVMGDAVNLGSRLEGLTKQYGVLTLVGPKTAKALSDNDEFFLQEVDLVKVKGKNEPVAIYQLEQRSELLTNQFDAFLEFYRSQNWDSALTKLDKLQQEKIVNITLADMYRQRIEHFRAEPPGEDWDGVFVHTSK